MKKLIVLLSAVILSTTMLSAQLVNFRIEAGPSFNFGKVKSGDEAFSNKNKTGYHVGAYVDVPVVSGFYLGSGLTFTMKGAKYEDNNASSDITLHYLQIPINAGYKFEVSRTIGVALQTGPYFSVALGGTSTSKFKLLNAKKSFDIFKDGVMGLGDAFKARRYDIGWNAAALAYFGNFYGTVGMDFGFLNVMNDGDGSKSFAGIKKDDLLNLHNAQVYIGLGMRF